MQSTTLHATVVGGIIKPDSPLMLPEHSRIVVKIAPLGVQQETTTPREAWESLKHLMRENPINSGGLRYTRDGLHERD